MLPPFFAYGEDSLRSSRSRSLSLVPGSWDWLQLFLILPVGLFWHSQDIDAA